MKIYVAGKWQNHIEIRTIMDTIEELGHEITLDWTKHVSPKNQDELMFYALEDCNAVVEASLYIGVFDKPFEYKGAYVEMGIALASGNKVWIIGNYACQCIFVNHPLVTIFPDLISVIESLKMIPKE